MDMKTKTKHQSKEAGTNTKPASTSSLALSKEKVMDCMEKAKIGGVVLGSIMGCFFKSGVLGACWVYNMFYETSDKTPDIETAHIAILLWSVFSGVAAVTICFMLRSLVWAVFTCTYDYETGDVRSRRVSEAVINRIVRNLEFWYGFGCVVGMSLFWSLACTILGMKNHVLQSFWVGLFVSAYWLFLHRVKEECSSVEDLLGHDAPVMTGKVVKDLNKPATRKMIDAPNSDMRAPLLSQHN